MEKTIAAVTNLAESDVAQVCSVLAHEGSSMEVKMPTPVTVGSAVKVETDDTISLGEVSYCRVEGDGYVVWVELMEALHNVGELSRMARALLS